MNNAPLTTLEYILFGLVGLLALLGACVMLYKLYRTK